LQQVRRGDARVGAGEKSPAALLDEPAKLLHRRFALQSRVIDDHRFAATAREFGQSHFVGHGAGQAQRVAERGEIGAIRLNADSANRGPRFQTVNGQEAVEPGSLVPKRENVFMLLPGYFANDSHRSSV